MIEKNEAVEDSMQKRDAEMRQFEEKQRHQGAELEKKMKAMQEKYKNLDREELVKTAMMAEGERDRLKQELEERARKVRKP